MNVTNRRGFVGAVSALFAWVFGLVWYGRDLQTAAGDHRLCDRLVVLHERSWVEDRQDRHPLLMLDDRLRLCHVHGPLIFTERQLSNGRTSITVTPTVGTVWTEVIEEKQVI